MYRGFSRKKRHLIVPIFAEVAGGKILRKSELSQVRSGQVWWHTPKQRIAASTLRRYSFGTPSGHRPSSRQARQARILEIGLYLSNQEACGRPLDMDQPLGSRLERIRWAGSFAGSRATCQWRRSWRARTMQVTCLRPASLSTRSLDI